MTAPKLPEIQTRGNSHTERVTARLRTYFLTGILVTAPVALSLYIVWSILIWIDSKVGSIIPIHITETTTLPGVGLVVAVVFFTVVGGFARNYFGRLLLRLSDYIMERLPLVKTIYGGLKQVMEMVMGNQAKAFREVVLVEYPRKGVWMMGFVTGQTEGEVQSLTDTEVVNVFIPTTPNPTSGFLAFIPNKEVVHLKMSVDEGIKMIISGGMITPKAQGVADSTEVE
jgi:uncharacterized membrane protein